MAIYNYNVSHKIEVVGSDAAVIESPLELFSGNGKLLYDNDLPVSADFDLSALLSEIEVPVHVAIKFFDDSGIGIALDGTIINVSTNLFTEFWFKYAPSASPAPPVMHIINTVKARLQVYAFGDPLPT